MTSHSNVDNNINNNNNNNNNSNDDNNNNYYYYKFHHKDAVSVIDSIVKSAQYTASPKPNPRRRSCLVQITFLNGFPPKETTSPEYYDTQTVVI